MLVVRVANVMMILHFWKTRGLRVNINITLSDILFLTALEWIKMQNNYKLYNINFEPLTSFYDSPTNSTCTSNASNPLSPFQITTLFSPMTERDFCDPQSWIRHQWSNKGDNLKHKALRVKSRLYDLTLFFLKLLIKYSFSPRFKNLYKTNWSMKSVAF